LNKWKKAISVGMSASLLASLFTVIAASSALASVTVTSAGTVPRGSTSAGTATFVFTENSAGTAGTSFPTTGGTLTVTINDNGVAAPEPGVAFVGTPVVAAPGSLGATASVAGNVLTITTTGSDTSNVEQITVSGLKISADLLAGTGAISATLGGDAAMQSAVTTATATATGTLATSVIAGALTETINVTSACLFAVTGGVNGQLIWGTVTDPIDITAAGALVAGQQTLTATTTAAHTAGEAVTQTVANCNLTGMSSPGTVADVVVQDAGAATTVNPGENNQAAANTTITEQTAGYLASGTVLTFTLSAGLFSNSPVVSAAGLTLGTSVCNISFDRKSCTVTTTSASAAPATITLGNSPAAPILLDIDASTPLGTAINVTVTGAPAINVSVDANTIAYVSRVVVGTAAQPTIFINYNDQASGQLTLTESAAGFFTDGTGSNNAFGLCITTGESFTRAPFAVVTAGDLKLLDGLVGGTSVRGTLFTGPDPDGAGPLTSSSCVRWTVYTASTAASTIEIRGSDASDVVLASGSLNGPRLSVPGTLTPGSTQANILIGSQTNVANGTAVSSVVSNAIRAYKSDIIVAAVSQPTIGKGATSHAGDITITETQAGQFKPGETICVDIQARSSNYYVQDTFFNTSSTNGTPIVQTNAAATGLLASGVSVNSSCGFADNRAAFSFSITQQAFGPTPGVITLSNMWMTTNADALNGTVLVRVFRSNTTGVDFGAFVSNAKVGAAVAGTAGSRLGVTQVGAFTTATKVQKVAKYVTFRFDFGVAAAGQHIDIWAATKTGNDWSGFAKVTSRVANASGVVYYYIRQSSATWKSYRGMWAGGGVFTPARQARWIP